MVDGNAFVVAPPSGVRVRSRFQPTDGEVSILRRIGEHLHGLYAADVNDRIAVGPVKQKDNQRARRKKALTGASSPRWAGSITNRANEQYRLSLMALDNNIASLMAAVSMTSTVGLWLVAVNPRNTSKAGRKHWLPDLKQKKPKNSRALPSSHHAAAVTIGRRAHLLRLSRHPSSPTARSAASSASANSVPQQKVHATTVSLDPNHPPPLSGTRWPEPVPTP